MNRVDLLHHKMINSIGAQMYKQPKDTDFSDETVNAILDSTAPKILAALMACLILKRVITPTEFAASLKEVTETIDNENIRKN